LPKRLAKKGCLFCSKHGFLRKTPFFVRKFGENFAFFVQNTASVCKIWIITLVDTKNAIFCQKLSFLIRIPLDFAKFGS
jgi:hypothetical protein